jgi:hypothetical protein
VGEDPVKAYKEKKRQERESEENELFVSDGKGKAPVLARGQVIDDEAGDLSD